MIDLSAVPVIDNHCHAYTRPLGPLDVPAYRRLFSEVREPKAATEHIQNATYYRWALKELGRVLGCAAAEGPVLERRAALSQRDLVALLLRDAPIEAKLIDTGLGGTEFLSVVEMRELTGIRVEWMLRIEVLAERLIPDSDGFDHFLARFDAALEEARAGGIVALKSIAAYRTGLQIAPVAPDVASAAFHAVQVAAARDGTRLRLANKPLIDFLVCRALLYAAALGLPMQFHTGYGDPDTDLRLGNPLHLRTLFEDPSFAAAPIVMLHESYPFTREAAYLAAVYENAYLDISYSVPFLDYHELLSCTHQALGVAPWSKVLYSSDGFGIPEHAWLGALHGRRVLAHALQAKIDAGELDGAEAMEAAGAILHDNSRRVYRL